MVTALCTVITSNARGSWLLDIVSHRNMEFHLMVCGADIFDRICTKDESHLHQFGTKMHPGICIGYALNCGGGLI